MKNKSEFAKNFRNAFSAAVIPVALVVAIFIYTKVMGNPANFMGNNTANNPLPGNFLGIIYKGGVIVPILITLMLTVITFSFERFFAISRASGKGAIAKFVRDVKNLLEASKIDEAKVLCDKQRGSVANVVDSALIKYQQVEATEDLTKDQKILAIQKDIEESTSLELPALEQNLTILATISSIGTLMGLLGTVIGMIKSFSALAHAGAPDSVALASGISEALINTALGISTAALSIIAYNYFTTKIDKLTYSIDEAGYSIVQTYAANHK
jgi:biopolymer transport protein ExbB